MKLVLLFVCFFVCFVYCTNICGDFWDGRRTRRLSTPLYRRKLRKENEASAIESGVSVVWANDLCVQRDKGVLGGTGAR